MSKELRNKTKLLRIHTTQGYAGRLDRKSDSFSIQHYSISTNVRGGTKRV